MNSLCQWRPCQLPSDVLGPTWMAILLYLVELNTHVRNHGYLAMCVRVIIRCVCLHESTDSSGGNESGHDSSVKTR